MAWKASQIRLVWLFVLATVTLPGLLQTSPAQSLKPKLADLAYPGPTLSPGRPIIELANQVLGIRDRCVTCHRFDSYADLPDPRSASTWNPYPGLDAGSVANDNRWLTSGNHPGGWLNWHPPQEFGCTVCHGGKGQALEYAAAGHSGAGKKASRLSPMVSGVEMLARCGACHPGDYVPGAEDVWRGRILIRELNCAACHPVGPNLAGTHRGPSLARVGEKLTRNQVAAWPQHYNDWVGNSRMPDFRTPQDVAWLVACFLVPENGGPRYGEDPRFTPTKEKMQAGLELVRKARCANCHVLPRRGGAKRFVEPDPLWDLPQGTVGPDLTHISARVSEAWVLDFLEDPQAWYPETRMPKYKVSRAELVPLVVWLFATSRQQNRERVLNSHKHTEPDEMAGLSEAEKYQLGKEWFVSLGCKGCHESGDDDVPWRTTAPSLKAIGNLNLRLLPESEQPIASLEEYFIRKLNVPYFMNPGSMMPKFDLSDGERSQIAAALLAEREAPSANYIKRLDVPRPKAWDSPTEYADEFWPRMIAPQGAGLPTLSGIERDLHPESCATCHREQYTQWATSRHAKAMGPGVTGQLVDWIASNPSSYSSCMRCHARLASQNHIRPVRDTGGKLVRDGNRKRQWEQNPHFQPRMYDTAHGCANCHVRAHERHSVEEPKTQYSWDSESLQAHPLKRSDYLSQSKFCKDCHQFDTDSLVEPGLAPRENTYAEWLEWFNEADEPKSCQECHMPDGDHSFKGIHDQDYVATNSTVTFSFQQNEGVMTARISLENSGGGHHFPTYITPKIFIRCYFSDANGEEIQGSRKQETVGRGAKTRRLKSGKTQWFDEFDTRIPAGEAYIYRYSEPIPEDAGSFQLEIFVAPDDFYHHLYEKWVGLESRSSKGLELLGQALLETKPEVSGYYLLRKEVLIEN